MYRYNNGIGAWEFFPVGPDRQASHQCAFCLFTLYGLAGREDPTAGALVVLGLIGVFKLMNQFEIRRKADRTKGSGND